jgi:hypothetical protein
MPSSFRRYEVLLPLLRNDGQPIPPEDVTETLLELRQRFNAVSWESQTIKGQWLHEGQVYLDDSTRVFVDVPDLAENRQFFVEFKEKMKARLQQLDIWITSYPVEVL